MRLTPLEWGLRAPITPRLGGNRWALPRLGKIGAERRKINDTKHKTSDSSGAPASSHRVGRSSFHSGRLPASFLDWPPPLEDPTPAESGSPTDCACRLPSPHGAGITSCQGCELLPRIAQTSLSGHLSGFVQHTIRVPTVTKVQSDRDLLLISNNSFVHKAQAYQHTQSHVAYSAFSSNLVSLRRFLAAHLQA
jgi:hypothetical protein